MARISPSARSPQCAADPSQIRCDGKQRRSLSPDGPGRLQPIGDGCGVYRAHKLPDELQLTLESTPRRNLPRGFDRVAQAFVVDGYFRQFCCGKCYESLTEILQCMHLPLALAFAGFEIKIVVVDVLILCHSLCRSVVT